MSKKGVPAPPTWTEQVESACRETIHRIPGLENLPEKQYLEAVDEGLQLILDGIRARLEEIDDDDDSDHG